MNLPLISVTLFGILLALCQAAPQAADTAPAVPSDSTDKAPAETTVTNSTCHRGHGHGKGKKHRGRKSREAIDERETSTVTSSSQDKKGHKGSKRGNGNGNGTHGKHTHSVSQVLPRSQKAH